MGYFSEINDRFLQYLKSDVDQSVALGLPDHLARLGDPSMPVFQRSLEAAGQLLAAIDAARVDGFYEKLDLELIARHLQGDIFFKTLELDGELRRRRKPGGVDGVSEGIFQLFVNDERSAQERLSDILSRLKQAPEYLRAELRVLTTPVSRWRDIEVEQAKEVPELFDSIERWAAETGFTELEELREQITRVNAALAGYVDALKVMSVTDRFAIGMDKVEELLAIKQIDRSPEQLRAMAAGYMEQTLNLSLIHI